MTILTLLDSALHQLNTLVSMFMVHLAYFNSICALIIVIHYTCVLSTNKYQKTDFEVYAYSILVGGAVGVTLSSLYMQNKTPEYYEVMINFGLAFKCAKDWYFSIKNIDRRRLNIFHVRNKNETV